MCPACGGNPAKKSSSPALATPEIDFNLGPDIDSPPAAQASPNASHGGWYYLADSQQVGPLPTEALGRMIRAGQIGENVMVWRSGMDSWAPFALVPELAPLAASAPGPAPVLPAAQGVGRHNGKSKITAGLLAILVGGLGIHKFYLGGWGWGILYIVFMWTFIPALVGLIEGIVYLTMSERAFDETYNHRDVSAFTW